MNNKSKRVFEIEDFITVTLKSHIEAAMYKLATYGISNFDDPGEYRDALVNNYFDKEYYEKLQEYYDDDDALYDYIMSRSDQEIEKLEQIVEQLKENLDNELMHHLGIDEKMWYGLEEDSYPDTKECYFGLGYHVGDGVYCDDDGDNWDF